MLNNNYNNNHNNNYYHYNSNSNNSSNSITTEINKRRRTRTINNTTTLLLCYLLFTISFFCLSPSSVVYANESKNCITKKDGKIVYNVDDRNNECALLYNIGDLSKGIGIINTVDDNLETNLTGTPCMFNSDTDSHMESYRDGIVAQNTKILNGSSLTISCRSGYSLNNSNNNKVYCSEGTLSYEFDGCYYTGNRGSSLADALNTLFGNGNNNIGTYTVSPNGEILTSAGTVLKDSNGNTVDQQYLADRGYSINDNGEIVDSNGDIVEEFSNNSNNGNDNNNNNSSFDISDLDIDEDMLSGDKEYTIGEPIVIACKEKEGYTLNPDKSSVVMTPLGNSQWDKQGECEYQGSSGESLGNQLNQYLTDKDYTKDNLTPSIDTNKHYAVGDTITLTCQDNKTGYNLSSTNNTITLTAGANNNWNISGTCEYTVAGCSPYTTDIANTTITYDKTANNGTYEIGTSLTLSCDATQGYSGTIANNTLTCNNGSWSGNTPNGSCAKIMCSATTSCSAYNSNISNTTVVYNKKAGSDSCYTEGTTATVSCGSNSYFDGNNDLTCSNGQWTGTVSGSCKTTNGCFMAKSLDTKSITIYYFTSSDNGSNNCTVDWGDGATDSCDQTYNSHSYSEYKQHIVKICGSNFKGIGGSAYNGNTWIKELISYGNWSQITSMYYTFFNNSKNLKKIHSGAFDGLPNVTNFDSTFFNCFSLTSIPAGLFDNNTAVTSFNGTFQNCTSLTEIPAGLFDKNTAVKYFESTFYGCSSLTSIPAGLFDNNTEVTYFSYTFYNCSSLKCVDIDGENNRTTVKAQRPLGGTNPITGKTSKWGASGVNMSNAKQSCKVQ